MKELKHRYTILYGPYSTSNVIDLNNLTSMNSVLVTINTLLLIRGIFFGIKMFYAKYA